MTGPDVVVIGSVNIDHVVEADAFPAPGETVRGRTARVGLGGKGALPDALLARCVRAAGAPEFYTDAATLHAAAARPEEGRPDAS